MSICFWMSVNKIPNFNQLTQSKYQNCLQFIKVILMSKSKDPKFTKNKPPIPPLPPKNNSMMSNIDPTVISDLHKKSQSMSMCIQEELGIKKWKIGKLLGGGASGSVYKALNIQTGVLAAVKKIIYLDEDLQDSRNQLKILAKIEHPNVVHYIEDYELENETWVFMELLPLTLYRFYKDFGVPPYENFVVFAKQIVQGLQYLHKEKIVHKDLKCSNIMLDSKSTVKLSDFGCSKGFQKTISLVAYEKSQGKSFRGTAFWLAPQAIKEGRYTRKTDVWSLGCTLLQLATGKFPWDDKNFDQQYQAMYYIASKEEIPQVPQELHENIQQLILSCLNRDPDKRLSCDQLLKLKIFNSTTEKQLN